MIGGIIMKKITKLVAIFCSIIFLCVAATGNSVLADGLPDGIEWVEPNPWPPEFPFESHSYYPLHDLEKLCEFFGQTDPDGIYNGEKVIGYYYPEIDFSIGIKPVLWNQILNENCVNFYFAFPTIQNVYWGGACDMIVADFYGELDLQGTTTSNVSMEDCHLSSVNLDNCSSLGGLILDIIDYCCSSVSAVNADICYGRITLRSGVKSMALGMRHFASQVNVNTVGSGCVGIEFRNEDNANARLQTKPLDSQEFVGWFKDGSLVSDSTVLDITEGGNYIAAYAGDINNDGCLNVADAVLIMREALGLVETKDVAMSDVNFDGSVGMSDAVVLLRAVMGV